MEYLILVGFVTLVISIVLGIAVFYTGNVQNNLRSNQVNEFANKVVSTSEYVFYAGEPSKATITAYVPDGVTNISIVENSLVVSFHDSGGESRLLFPSNVNITGTLTSGEGIKNIEIMASGGQVVISPA